MKKLFLGLLVTVFTLSIYSCRETTEENVEIEFEEAAEETEEAFEEAGNEIEEEIEGTDDY